LHERFKVKGINHQKAYSYDGARLGMVKKHFFLHWAGTGSHSDLSRCAQCERGNEHAAGLAPRDLACLLNFTTSRFAATAIV
jgi:hypothetical protein